MQFRYVLGLLGTNTLTHMIHVTHAHLYTKMRRQTGGARQECKQWLPSQCPRSSATTHTHHRGHKPPVHPRVRHELCRGRRARFRAEEEGARRGAVVVDGLPPARVVAPDELAAFQLADEDDRAQFVALPVEVQGGPGVGSDKLTALDYGDSVTQCSFMYSLL